MKVVVDFHDAARKMMAVPIGEGRWEHEGRSYFHDAAQKTMAVPIGGGRWADEGCC